MARAEEIIQEMKRRKWKWIGHVFRRDKIKAVLRRSVDQPNGGRRRRCHPKTTWRRMVELDRNAAEWNTWNPARHVAADRTKWSKDVRALPCA